MPLSASPSSSAASVMFSSFHVKYLDWASAEYGHQNCHDKSPMQSWISIWKEAASKETRGAENMRPVSCGYSTPFKMKEIWALSPIAKRKL